jgi:hypothetical protein
VLLPPSSSSSFAPFADEMDYRNEPGINLIATLVTRRSSLASKFYVLLEAVNSLSVHERRGFAASAFAVNDVRLVASLRICHVCFTTKTATFDNAPVCR